MKKLLIAVFVGIPLVGCTEEVIVKKVPPAGETPAEGDPGTPTDGADAATTDPPAQATADNCLDGQDLDGADIDVKSCPAIPSIPADVKVEGKKVSLGAWELGTTAEGETYKYGTLSKPGTDPRVLSYDGGETKVNAENLECWSKGYYRLRKILQDPPAEWLALKNAGYQYRFFQFQTDMRNGATGFKGISSFEDHLIKWVTVISKTGECQQPTLTKFRDYAKSELKRRGLPNPG